MTVLILTHPADHHALAVALGLQAKGAEPLLWHTPDFPMRAAESLRLGAAGTAIEVDAAGLELDPRRVTAVWNRRPSYALDPAVLDPADLVFAERSLEQMRRSLLTLLRPDAFWVNPQEAVEANTKPIQLARARAAGFRIPETLVTNDPTAIRRFLADQGGRVVFKPLTRPIWRSEEAALAPYSQLITAEDLVDDDLLRAAPGIYQEPVVKSFEVRLTMLGDRPLAARLLSQETQHGRIDWRRSYGELVMEPLELPGQVAEMARTFLDSMGFVFGCLDLIVTPEDEWVFVENNQAGQFLFVEQEAGMPMLDAFCEMLLQGRPDFAWDPAGPHLRLADFEQQVADRCRELSERHARRPDPSWPEAPAGEVE